MLREFEKQPKFLTKGKVQSSLLNNPQVGLEGGHRALREAASDNVWPGAHEDSFLPTYRQVGKSWGAIEADLHWCLLIVAGVKGPWPGRRDGATGLP